MTLELAMQRPKAIAAAVQGKITAVAEDGTKIGQWGGTECFLSREKGIGPCLVVTTTSNRKRCTLFSLLKLRRVLPFHVAAGKLTVMLPHAQRQLVSVFIETKTDIEELQLMAATLQDRAAWAQLERGVAKRGVARGRGSGARETADTGGTGRSRTREVDRTMGAAEPNGVYVDDEAYAADGYSRGGDFVGEDVDEDPYEAEALEVAAAAAANAERTALSPRAATGEGVEGFNLTSLAQTLQDADRGSAALSKRGVLTESSAAAINGKGDTRALRPWASTAIPILTCTSGLFEPGAGVDGSNSIRQYGGAAATRQQLELIRDTLLDGASVFLTGPPGSGKTTLSGLVARALVASSEGRKEVALTATSGPAALFLGGIALHRFAGAPSRDRLVVAEDLANRILTARSHRDARRRWLTTDVLIIDDINEVSAGFFGALAEVGRRVRQAGYAAGEIVSGVGAARDSGGEAAVEELLARPFGGIRLLVAGDFLGTPPPPSLRSGEEVLPAFGAAAWAQCSLQCLRLTPPVPVERGASVLAAYQQFLEDVRQGEYTVAVDDVVQRALARTFDGEHSDIGDSNADAIVVEVVGSVKEAEMRNITKLATVVHEAKTKSASTAAVTTHTYPSSDYAAEPGADVGAEIPLPGTLTLCVGAPVMLLASAPGLLTEDKTPTKRRDSSCSSFFHPTYGSIGVVTGFHQTTPSSVSSPLPIVRFSSPRNPTASAEGIVGPVCIAIYERAPLTTSSDIAANHNDADINSSNATGPMLMSRTQVPLRLAYALPATALHNAPPLRHMRICLDKAYLSQATASAAMATSQAAVAADDALLAGRWGLAVLALSRLADASGLLLDGFDRKCMRAARSDAALDFYASLFPPTREEISAKAAKQAEEKGILEQRRRQRRRGGNKRARNADEAEDAQLVRNCDGIKKKTEGATEGDSPDAAHRKPERHCTGDAATVKLQAGTEAVHSPKLQKPRTEDGRNYAVVDGDERPTEESFQITLATQASAETDLWNSSQMQTMVHGLLMDDDE